MSTYITRRLGLVLAISTLLLGGASSVTILPAPNGTYTTNVGTLQLVDHSRLDPFAPTPQARRMMVSAWYPVSKQPCQHPLLADYMGAATARSVQAMFFDFAPTLPNDTFTSFKLQVCSDDDDVDDDDAPDPSPRNTSHQHQHQHHPLVLFDIGLGITRHLYNALAQELASQGFIVVTLDHPYDASIVEFPDGSTVAGSLVGANITEAQLTFATGVRVQDARFVLDQLQQADTARRLVPYVRSGFNTSRVPMVGHSFGGAAAIAAAAAAAGQNETRLVGVGNLDGGLFLADHEIRIPALLFGSVGHNRTDDASWAAAWPRFRGWRREVLLQQGRHLTFCDYPLLIKLLGIIDQVPEASREGYRYPDAMRSRYIVTRYVVAFLRFVLGGGVDPLLEEDSAAFPEIVLQT